MSISRSIDKDVKGIQFFPNEEVIYVQREHIIILFIPALAIIAAALITISAVIAIMHFRYIQDPLYLILMLQLALILLSLLSTFAVYSVMKWFYQFYIITSKRLVHIHYFRIGGFHLEEVFYLQTKPTEIERHPRNFILDFLGIEDVLVYFKNLERTVPFTFEFPSDSKKVEELVEELALGRLEP